jgi:hypothetical protein
MDKLFASKVEQPFNSSTPCRVLKNSNARSFSRSSRTTSRRCTRDVILAAAERCPLSLAPSLCLSQNVVYGLPLRLSTLNNVALASSVFSFVVVSALISKCLGTAGRSAGTMALRTSRCSGWVHVASHNDETTKATLHRVLMKRSALLATH